MRGRVASISEGITANMSELFKMASDSTQEAAAVKESSQKLSELAESLQSLVGQFKI